MFGASTCGWRDGEQAANTHTALDGFEAPVDFRVGGTCRDGDVRERAVGRPRSTRSTSAPRCRRWPELQRRNLSEQRSSRRSGQPHLRGVVWGRGPPGAASLPVASDARSAWEEARHQTTRRVGVVQCRDGRRTSGASAGTGRQPSARQQVSRCRELPGRVDGFRAGPFLACAGPAPATAGPVTTAAPAQARSGSADPRTSDGSVCASAYRPRRPFPRTAAARGRGHAAERPELAGHIVAVRLG